MSAAIVDNNSMAFDLNAITPNKRKRNAVNKENPYHTLSYAGNCMEVKSLAELLPSSSKQMQTKNNNAFEICRKPPKKRSKLESNVGPQCFDNAALNLHGPDHVVNPFEIRRSELPPAVPTTNTSCFVNAALNIRGPEKELRNPFEIVRQDNPNVQPIISTGKMEQCELVSYQ